MPLKFRKLGRGHVQRQPATSTNIYEGMVTRNMTEATYTTDVDGSAISLVAAGRTKPGPMPTDMGTLGILPRQPKGMFDRSANEGKGAFIHTTPKN